VSVKAGGALVLGILAALLTGCGSGSAVSRTAAGVENCLRAEKIVTRNVPSSGASLPKGFVRDEVDLLIPRDLTAIRVYPRAEDAAHAFAAEKSTSPIVQLGNVIVAFAGAPVPSADRALRLEACAFGPHARPAVSPLVVDFSHLHTGRAVMLQSGCLACHRIGADGNDGPGPNLSDLGNKEPPAAIARELRHPTAPMPSFSSLSPRDFRALVEYLSQLRTS
jgi:cytochrome c2